MRIYIEFFKHLSWEVVKEICIILVQPTSVSQLKLRQEIKILMKCLSHTSPMITGECGVSRGECLSTQGSNFVPVCPPKNHMNSMEPNTGSCGKNQCVLKWAEYINTTARCMLLTLTCLVVHTGHIYVACHRYFVCFLIALCRFGVTKCWGLMVRTCAFCSQGPWSKYLPGDQLSWLWLFMVFISPSRKT